MIIPPRWRRWPVFALAVVAVLLVLGRVGAGIVTDYLWYASMGAAALWRERALFISAVCVGSALVAAAILFVNLYVVRQSVVSLVLPRRVANIEIGEEVPGRYLVGAALLIALVLGWWLALPAESWRMFSLLRHGIAFGETDPYVEMDLGFFVYWLPIESMLYYRTLTTVLFATVVVIFFYALTPSLRWDRGALYVSHYVRRHLAALGAVLLLLLAWSYRLDIYESLLFGSGPGGAFSYSDHRTVIPVSILARISHGGHGARGVLLRVDWAGACSDDDAHLRAAHLRAPAARDADVHAPLRDSRRGYRARGELPRDARRVLASRICAPADRSGQLVRAASASHGCIRWYLRMGSGCAHARARQARKGAGLTGKH